MAAEVLEVIGERLDLVIRRGVTLGPIPHVIVLDDEDETPFDLTGYVFRGYIRRTKKSVGAFTDFEFDTSRLSEGIYTFGIHADDTAGFLAGSTVSDVRSKYFWDTEMESPDGRVIPLFYGEIKVALEITRE
jgi:hypothetical protein